EDSDKSEIELDPPDTKKFPGLLDVNVKMGSREMIMYWAKIARRNIRAKKKRPSEDDENEASEFGADDDNNPDSPTGFEADTPKGRSGSRASASSSRPSSADSSPGGGAMLAKRKR
ncbi:unnamed protein product, partial [Polarella glacialis]